jgi:outer membrane protein assembly factor BamB
MCRHSAPIILVCGALLLATAGTSLAAEWTMLGGGPDHTAFRADAVALPVSLLWKYNAAGEGGVMTTWSSPAVGDDAVFFCYDTNVYCVGRWTGQLRWSYDTRTQLRSSPAIDATGVYVGGTNGVLYAIARDTGRLMWRHSIPGSKAIESSPVIYRGVLYVGSNDYNVYAIDLGRREVKWQFKTTGEVKASPMVRANVCYGTSVDGNMYAIDSEGRQIWLANLGPGPAFMAPSFERDKILAPAGNRVVALDVRSGVRRWTFDKPGDLISGAPAVANRMVYVGSKDGSLYGVNANSGYAVWRYPSGTDEVTQPILSGPAVCGDTVFARTSNGILVGVDARTGKLQWRYNMLVPAEKATRGAEDELRPGGEDEDEDEEDEEEEEEDYGGDDDEEGGFFGGGGRGWGGGGRVRQDRSKYRRGSSVSSLRSRREPSPGFGGRYGAFAPERGAVEDIRLSDNILSSLAVSGNAIYALGDDGALYALAATAADRDAPAISEAVLQMPGADRNTYQVVLDVVDGAETPGRLAYNVQVPGTPPLTVSMKLFDEGSGVDVSSIQVSLDNQPQQTWTFDEKENLLWFSYNPAGIARPLPNGQHDVVVEASDYRGQAAVASMSFLVDNALPAPTSATAGGGRGGEEDEEDEEDDED